jgi:threonine/homoserine/homoserine lactone efflux protein
MYLAGLPQFSSPEGDAVAQALVLSVLFIVHCFLLSLVVWFAQGLGCWLSAPRGKIFLTSYVAASNLSLEYY